MLKVCLDNSEHCARSPVPDCIFKEFTMATMTALQKPDWGHPWDRNQHVFS